MFQIMQTFSAWMFNGAAQSVIDFCAVILTFGCVAIALCPAALIVKYIFKH